MRNFYAATAKSLGDGYKCVDRIEPANARGAVSGMSFANQKSMSAKRKEASNDV